MGATLKLLNFLKIMNIIIKDVTGDNAGLIRELSRAGFPAGSIVRNVKYDVNNHSCRWSSVSDNCTAWVGVTCVILPKITQIHIFSLQSGGMAIDAFVNGKKVGPVKWSREDVLSFTSNSDQLTLAVKYLLNP